MNLRKKLLTPATVCLYLVLQLGPCARCRAGIMNCTWSGPNNGKWSVAANWDCNMVPNNTPTTSYNVKLASGTVNLDIIRPTINKLTMNGGSITQIGGAIPHDLIVNGKFLWTSGNLSTTENLFPTVTANGGLMIGPVPRGKSTPMLLGFELINNKPATLMGTDFLAGSARITNNSTFTITDNSGLKLNGDRRATFDNQPNGSLIKSGGRGTSTFDANVVNDGGNIAVRSGTLAVGQLTQEKGTTTVTKGATLQSAEDLQISGGTLTGLGTVRAPNVINGGDLKATLAQDAQLEIQGSLIDMDTGDSVSTFDSAVGGPWSDPDYNSVVAVTGNAVLDGNLRVTVWPGYVPPSDHEFDVMTIAGTLSGEFLNVHDGRRLTTADGSGSFLVRYESSGFEHVVALTDFRPSAAIPEPASLISALVAGFLITGFWRVSKSRLALQEHGE